MAIDVSISGMTSATTPLAGTEVLPIVTGGANFKVSVDNLTAGRPVSASALTLSSTDLTFSSIGQKIIADMTNATRSSRLNFQTSTANSASGVGIIPSGSATTASWVAYAAADPDNAAFGQFHASFDHVGINSSKTGTGVTQPIEFQIDNVTKAAVSTAGVLRAYSSLSVGSSYTASTPPSNGAIIQGFVGINNNAPLSSLDLGAAGNSSGTNSISWSTSGDFNYFNIFPLRGGTKVSIAKGVKSSTDVSETYISSYGSSISRSIVEVGDGITFYVDAASVIPTGTTITPTARMYINSNGKVGIGTTSPVNALDVTGSISATGTISSASMNVSGLTASYVVATDASKNLTSIQYTTAATASTLVQRDTTAGVGARRFYAAFQTLTDAATIAVDMSYANFNLTLGGNRTLGAPTNLTAGQSGVITVRQDATGARTLAYAWPYVFPGGAAPTLSTSKFSMDQLNYVVNSYSTGTCTMTIATPCVVTKTAHGFVSGMRVQFTTTGALPTGISLSTTYWVLVLDANTFQLSTSLANLQAGTYVATSGTQSGTHTVTHSSITVTLNPAINA